MRATALAALTFALASPAEARFVQRDLTRVTPDVTGYEGGGTFTTRAERGRLTLACLDCSSLVAIDVLIGRSTDGTEGRLRSGATTAVSMQAQCRAKEPSCRIEAVEAGGAIGIQSMWAAGPSSVSTVYLYRDGDLLTIRSLAGDSRTAEANATRAVQTLAPSIVGN